MMLALLATLDISSQLNMIGAQAGFSVLSSRQVVYLVV